MTDLALRLLVLLAAIQQIAFPFLVNPFREGHQAFRTGVPSQIEPAGYAFSIWGVIYLLALAYAVWQLTPAGRAAPVTARIAPLAIPLYLGSSLWLYVAKEGPFWATMPILVAMALAAATALVIATPPAAPGAGVSRQLSLVVLAFGLYAGWTACATFVNIAEVAPRYGFGRFGLSIPGYAVLSIAAATLVAAVVLWLTGGAIAFAATVVWALAAIIVAAQARGHDPLITAAAGAGIATVAAVTLLLCGRRQTLAA